jgi:hypothetical protein
VDYLNPTPEEIRDWGSDPDAEWPDQEWDTTVATSNNVDLIFSLANQACPQAEFFVHCLYVLVGSCVASGGEFISRSRIDTLLTKAENSPNADLRRWVERSRAFLCDPDAYDRSCWVEGGWALDDEIWRRDSNRGT